MRKFTGTLDDGTEVEVVAKDIDAARRVLAKEYGDEVESIVEIVEDGDADGDEDEEEGAEG